MIFYYQTVETGQQQWQMAHSPDEDRIRREKAFHSSVYHMDKDPEGVAVEEIRYKGDLWFDIDHKPGEGEDPKHAIHDAITDVRRLLSYYEALGGDPKHLLIYASGGKGFHVCVPASLFNGGQSVKMLPKIYKYMAKIIAERAAIVGMDMSMYAVGKGKMLRVENKPRSNGKFKVPVTVEEVKVMNPEMYFELTSKPRVVQTVAPIGIVQELASLYLEAHTEYDRMSKMRVETVSDEMLAVFNDDYHPACVNQIANNVGCKTFEGSFNAAKMSMARYLISAPLTEKGRDNLLDVFAENWTPSRYRTAGDRKKAVTEAYGFARENGFACSFMYSLLNESPCSGCPLREEQDRALAERSPVQGNKFAYIREGRTPVAISNFVLKVTSQYRDIYDDPMTFDALDCDAMRGDKVITSLHLTHRAWLSNAEFKKQVSNKVSLIWTGNDNDLQHLKALLTDPTALEGIQLMKQTKAMGIHHHVDEELGIDEFVWVEDSWSTNGVVNDHLKYNGPKGADDAPVCLKLQSVRPFTGVDDKQNLTIKRLLHSNTPDVVAPVLGWMMGCWLRSHWRSSDDTNKHLPGLQVYGSSGHGKTETATLFATLAGADYVKTEPLVVSASTPYAIKTEASLTTTVPRIFDEMNEHKISERNKYNAAREAVKSSARAGAQKTGVIGDNGAAVDSKPSTAPIIMLATQLNAENEVQERTVPVSINKAKRTLEHTANFRHVRSNVEHLRALAARAMRVTLNLPMMWVEQAIERNRLLIDEEFRDDRTGMNWQFVLVGLDYLEYVLSEQVVKSLTGWVKYESAPEDLLADVRQLKSSVLQFLERNKKELSVAAMSQEIDKIIDTFGEMVIEPGSFGMKLKHGEHYYVYGATLYVWSSVFFPQYVRYCRTTRAQPPELTSIKQYNDLVAHQDYFIGAMAPAGARVTQGWHAFEIPALQERGVRIENFVTS